jgi:hypothetical protein
LDVSYYGLSLFSECPTSLVTGFAQRGFSLCDKRSIVTFGHLS